MTHYTKPRVGESTATTGTGVIALAGRLTAHTTFSAICSVGDTVFYDICAVDANGAETGDWEEGLATYSAADQLTRTTVLNSSNAGAAVNFAAGTKYVRLVAEARQIAAVPRGGSAGAVLVKNGSGDYDTAWVGSFSGTSSGTNTGDQTAASLGLGNVTNDAQTKAAVVPNTAPSAGQILIGNGTAYAAQTATGDVTVASNGAMTLAARSTADVAGASATLVPSQSAVVAYVAAFLAGFDAKPEVAYCSTSALPANTYANGTLGVGATLTGNANGPLIIDGVTLVVGAVGMGILVAGEAAPENNGWYTLTQVGVVAVSKYILTRDTRSDQAAEIASGYLTAVSAPTALTPGSANNGKLFMSACPSPFTVGTSSLSYTAVGTTYTADEITLHLSGTQISIKSGYLAASATTDTTNASNISSGTLAAARGGAGPRSRVAADLNRSLTTFTAVTGLSFTATAGAKYAGRVTIKCISSGDEGIKFDFGGGSATATSFWAVTKKHVGAADAEGTLIAEALTDPMNYTSIGDSAEALIEIYFSMVCNTGGTVIPRWAQDTHIAGTATIRLGSSMTVELIP